MEVESDEESGNTIGLAVGLGLGIPIFAGGAGIAAFILVRKRRGGNDDVENMVPLMAIPLVEVSDANLASFEQVTHVS